MGALRIFVIVCILGIGTFVLMPLQMVATRYNWPIARSLPFWWQRIARRLIRLRVRVEGQPAEPPLLIAANHVSWLDITVLGSVMPLSFIAKAEVATWPVLGTLARLQRTVFVDRTRRSQTGSATKAIAQRVDGGDVMVLFAEGTTGDGCRVLPFRSALIGAARAAAGGNAITVQPVAVTYTRIQGIPVGCADRPEIAWYGDMGFVGHFRKVIGRGAIDAVVSFGEPIACGPDVDRKQVAEDCYASVRRMVEAARSGASSGRNHGDVFSPEQKDAKQLEKTPTGGYVAGAGERIANRAS